MTDFLSSYRPLCYRAAGAKAANDHSLPPFVDHSCRREPDLEAKHPSITNLCRVGKFAVYRNEGDRVFFLTVKTRLYPGPTAPQQRAVAALEVVKRFDSHVKAARWYRIRGLSLPGNCVIPRNTPLGLDHTAHPKRNLRAWEREYERRARADGVFLACRVIFRELRNPPVVTIGDIRRIFRRVPGTWNPSKIEASEFDALVALARKRMARKRQRNGRRRLQRRQRR